MPEKLLPTTVVGSYTQPDWLIDRENLTTRLPPRVRAQEIWRIPPKFLEAAQDDATLLAIRDMERAGIDIISDGEVRRESYSNRVATALGGIDTERHGYAKDRSGKDNPVPRVMGKIHRPKPIEVSDVEFLRANTDRRIKITLPGPFTMTQQAQDDYYGGDQRAMAIDYARAVNEEVKDMFTAGADVVQIDEPYMQARAEIAKEFALEVLGEALKGVEGTTAVHMCFGYAAIHAWQGLGKPDAYSFLPELNGSDIDQISIEAAPAGHRPGRAGKAAGQDHHPGRHRQRRSERRITRNGGGAHPGGARTRIARAAHPGSRLRHEIHGPRHRLRQAQVHGRGRRHRARGDRGVGESSEINPLFCRRMQFFARRC